ncbi:MAG: helix-turn-helix transcriptional regulator [Clostridia bacterium]|nr:helix-turn-helix transcriptional regulator [Clostridia bacterium]
MGNKTLTYGNVDMLVLKLLENRDMYGYQIIEQLEKQSDNTFRLSAGSLYPLLHNLENKDYVDVYEADTNHKTPGKKRKYYHITEKGKKYLFEKASEWESYSKAINSILFFEEEMVN